MTLTPQRDFYISDVVLNFRFLNHLRLKRDKKRAEWILGYANAWKFVVLHANAIPPRLFFRRF